MAWLDRQALLHEDQYVSLCLGHEPLSKRLGAHVLWHCWQTVYESGSCKAYRVILDSEATEEAMRGRQ